MVIWEVSHEASLQPTGDFAFAIIKNNEYKGSSNKKWQNTFYSLFSVKKILNPKD